MDLFTFPPFLLVCLKLPVVFVSVFKITSFPHKVCHEICNPWWCAAIDGIAVAISSGYSFFPLFAFFGLRGRYNGKGNSISNSLLLHLVIGLIIVASHSQPIRLL